MELFNLPHTAIVNRVVPKNAFDSYATTKQKKLFTDLIARITWTHKLSTDTINLEGKIIKEIQVFRVELKVKEDIQKLLDIIDRSIPYHIVFVISFDGKIYISTSSKHSHPIDENNAVIDWTFKTGWFPPSENQYNFQLRKSIDAVYHDFCAQLSGIDKSDIGAKSLQELINFEIKVDALEKERARLKSGIANCKQFNRKVALNLRLKEVENELRSFCKTQSDEAISNCPNQ